MSRFAIFTLSAALALAGAASAADSAADCKADYDTAVFTSTTMKAKCAVLVAFSKCLGEFPRDSAVEMELVTKNEKACESQWKEVGTPQVRTKRGDFQIQVDDAKDITFYRHRRETINVFDMNEDLMATKKELAEAKKEVAASKDELAAAKKAIADKSAADAKTLEAAVAAAIKKLEDSTKASIAKVNSDATAAQAKVDATVKQVKADAAKQASAIDQKLKDSEAKSSKAVATLSTKVNVDVKKSIDDVKKGMADKPIHMWSGYPKSHNRGYGWANFVTDVTEIDTLSPYAKKISSTHFQILKNGLYKFEINMLGYTSSRGHSRFQLNIGGQWINDATHKYAYDWKQITFTVLWPCKAGQTVYSRVYASNNGNPYKWHSGRHSRFQMSYAGQYGNKCTGNRCTI